MDILVKDIPNVLSKLTENINELADKFEKNNKIIRFNENLMDFLKAYQLGHVSFIGEEASPNFKGFMRINYVKDFSNPIADVSAYFETVRTYVNELLSKNYNATIDFSAMIEGFIEYYRIEGESSQILRNSFKGKSVDFGDCVIPLNVKNNLINYAKSYANSYIDTVETFIDNAVSSEAFAETLSKFIEISGKKASELKYDDAEGGFVPFTIESTGIKIKSSDVAFKNAINDTVNDIQRAYGKLIEKVGEPILSQANKIGKYEDYSVIEKTVEQKDRSEDLGI